MQNVGLRGTRTGRLSAPPVHRATVSRATQQERAWDQKEADAPASSSAKSVTIEYQRAQAKDLVRYFKEQKEATIAEKAQVFGWTKANEIGNGRWVMFGFAVGLLTEYATGANFPQQLKLLLSYLGIADVE